MKKNITTLLIAAITSVLCFAQESPVIPPVAPVELTLGQKLQATKTIAEVAGLEAGLSSTFSTYNEEQASSIAGDLRQAYDRCVSRHEVVGGYWTLGILPKYVLNWDTSASIGCVSWFTNTLVYPARSVLIANIKNARTAAALNSAVTAYLSTNLFPARLQATNDSRKTAVDEMSANVAQSALAIGHPEAINWALCVYRQCPVSAKSDKMDGSVKLVAAALKAKDFNLVRANAWIQGQNTGTPACAFTDDEKTTPSLLVASPYLPDLSIDTAKVAYRVAKSGPEIDTAIYKVATALKALDFNLSRANGWIKSQKDGTSFILP